MRTAVIGAALPAAYAAWPTAASYKGRSPLVLEDGCYSATDGAPIKCSTAPAGSVKLNVDSAGNAQPNCAWHSDVDFVMTNSKAGGLVATFGPKVAGMPGCCQAMSDVMATVWGGNFGLNSLLSNCQTEECVANGTTGYLNPIYWPGNFNISASAFVGRAPSDAQMAKNMQILLQNNAQCLDAGISYMSANSHTTHNAVLAGVLSGHRSTVWASMITSTCDYDPTYPAASAAACRNSSKYYPIISEEKCFSGVTGSPMNGPMNCSANPPVRVSAPNCMWLSTTPAIIGSFNMHYGPVAAAIPGCCHALLDTTMVAYSAGNLPFTASKCQSHTGCLADTSAQPTNYWLPSSNSTVPSAHLVGTMPNYNAWTAGLDRVLANGAQCFNAASAYFTANSALGSNVVLGPAYSGYVTGMRAVTVNATRGCKIPGVDFGSVKVACCTAIRALLADKNNVADAYSGVTTAFCAESGCASSVLTALKAVPAASWSLEHERVKTVLGASTLYAAATPDVCATSLPAYLTTTSTTTTTTPAPVAEAVRVTSEYVAVETLPVNVSASTLMASAAYTTAKRDGLAAALAVPASTVVITGFEVTVSRRQLSVARALSSSVSVKTVFVVTVADAAAATALSTTLTTASAAIKTQTDAAMASADWTGEAITAPTMAAPTVAAASVAAAPVMTSGSWTIDYFTDATCTTVDGSATALSGSIAASGCQVAGGNSKRIARCGFKAEVESFSSVDCSGSATLAQTQTDVCSARVGVPGKFERITCTAPVAAVSSAAGLTGASVLGLLLLSFF